MSKEDSTDLKNNCKGHQKHKEKGKGMGKMGASKEKGSSC